MTHDCMQMYIIFLPSLHAYYIIFYLVDDICDTKPTFSYQYFIIIVSDMNARYARVSPISPPIFYIRYEKPTSDTMPYPIFRTLT